MAGCQTSFCTVTYKCSSLILAGYLTWLGFLTATSVQSQPAYPVYEPHSTPPSPTNAASLNDCGLRAVISILAEKGLYPKLPTLVGLLSFRYLNTGGRPAGEGYSLSDLQWLLHYFGVPSRGYFLPRSSLKKGLQPLILRISGEAGGHFVVLQSVDDFGVATIYDPSQGVLAIPLEALASRWVNSIGRGIALVTGDITAPVTTNNKP
jgi:ABC-type bacteriocin/lantibiotic exporter with double-glycine peptidase domain